jgi:hypothetical protein
MRDRCPVGWTGKVFLALVRERSSSRCTGFGHLINLFNGGIGEHPAGKATEWSELGHFSGTAPLCEHKGGWSASKLVPKRVLAPQHKPPASAVRSLTVNDVSI